MTIYEFTEEMKKNSHNSSKMSKVIPVEGDFVNFAEVELEDEKFEERIEQQVPKEKNKSLGQIAFFLLCIGVAFLGFLVSISALVLFATAACILACQNHFFNNLVWTSWEFIKLFSVFTLSFALALFSPNLGMGLLQLKLSTPTKDIKITSCAPLQPICMDISISLFVCAGFNPDRRSIFTL